MSQLPRIPDIIMYAYSTLELELLVLPTSTELRTAHRPGHFRKLILVTISQNGSSYNAWHFMALSAPASIITDKYRTARENMRRFMSVASNCPQGAAGNFADSELRQGFWVASSTNKALYFVLPWTLPAYCPSIPLLLRLSRQTAHEIFWLAELIQ